MRVRDGLVIGLLAIPGALVGVVLVNALPERAIEYAFAVLLIWIAWTLGRGAVLELRGDGPP